MRSFGHRDPVDKHHAPVEVRWLKQVRRQLRRAERHADGELKITRQRRATILRRRMIALQVTLGVN